VRERDHLEYRGVNRRIIFRWVLRKWVGGMDWINLAYDRRMWWALVNAAMKLWVPFFFIFY